MYRSGKGIQRAIYYALTFVFAIVYALTVTPFTVNFFRRIVSTPESNLFLFNWDLLPLPKVHEFFLPLFILILELISLRLAIGIWSAIRRENSEENSGKNSARPLRRLLIILFLVFQAFPLFAVYYDARHTEYNQRRAKATYDAGLVAYDTDFLSRQDEYNRLSGEIGNQIRFLESNINSAKNQRLVINVLTDPNATTEDKEFTKQQIGKLDTEISRLETDLNAKQLELQQLQRPKYEPDIQVDETKLVPLPGSDSDLEFMTNNAITWNSFLSFFVSLIFPTIVFGAGYVFANFSTAVRQGEFEESGPRLAPINITRELRECSKLKNQRAQLVFVENLKPILQGNFTTSRVFGKSIVDQTTFTLELEREHDIVDAFGSLQTQIRSSGIDDRAKEILRQFVDQLMETQTWQPKGP